MSVWPVAFAALLYYEGPICIKKKVSAWHTAFGRERQFPIDMAGFATNLKLLLNNPGAAFTRSKFGFMETNFLKQLQVSVEELECKGEESMEVCVGRELEVPVYIVVTIFCWSLRLWCGMSRQRLQTCRMKGGLPPTSSLKHNFLHRTLLPQCCFS